MTHTSATEAVKHLLGFPFRDARWSSKLLIGSLIFIGNFIIPILPAILILGYTAQIVHRIIEGDGELHLPEWSDIGKLFTDGFRLFAATWIYSLPLVLLFTFGFFAMFVPLFFIPLLENTSEEGILVTFMLFGQCVFFVSFGIAMFFGIIYTIISPAMLVHTAARQKFTAAFDIGTWFRIFKTNFWGFVVAALIMGGIYIAQMYLIQITYMTLICCWLIPFLMAPLSIYMQIISMALYAEAYKSGRAKLAQPVEAAPAA